MPSSGALHVVPFHDHLSHMQLWTLLLAEGSSGSYGSCEDAAPKTDTGIDRARQATGHQGSGAAHPFLAGHYMVFHPRLQLLTSQMCVHTPEHIQSCKNVWAFSFESIHSKHHSEPEESGICRNVRPSKRRKPERQLH